MGYDNWKSTNPDDDTLGSREQHRPRRVYEMPPGACECCDQHRGEMMPPHQASDRCESGKRDHCTCDACF